MALGHASIGLLSPLLLAGSIVMIWFIVLAGVKNVAPLNRTWFLQADTSGITGAKDMSQWTYLYVCGEHNRDCGKASPAMPFGHAWAGRATGVPDSLIGKYGGHTTSEYYFYMWRFGWVFFIMALFFEICAFFTSFLACCGRLGAGIGSLVTLLAMFFLTIAVSLMTATFVKARNAFHDAGHSAKLGKYAFGFAWAAWAALFLSFVLLAIGTAARKRSSASTPPANDRPLKRRGWRRNRTEPRANGSFSKAGYDDHSHIDGSSV